MLCARLAGHLCGHFKGLEGGLNCYGLLCAHLECVLKEHYLYGCDLIDRTPGMDKANKKRNDLIGQIVLICWTVAEAIFFRLVTL